ncbi:uncharacterized protein [Pempheris klunzingeri]|uniref:uncharacterized protein n=1 Tax=Pempheris klunzingeri TaxID=3127111 RepID=UPI00397F1C29
MEGSESSSRERTTRNDGNQEADHQVLMSSKPLHRFLRKEPRSLGIVLIIFGCAEVLMGFHLTSENLTTSTAIYIPFWQGILFLICGNLSIYTAIHPSKKMVTVCLAMYVVSLLGILVSVGYRIYCLIRISYWRGMGRFYWQEDWKHYEVEQLFIVEVLLFTSSLGVSVLLMFLCTVARLALKSTHTQVIIQRIPPPPNGTTSS